PNQLYSAAPDSCDKISGMHPASKIREMSPTVAVIIWAGLIALGVALGLILGFGGFRFAAAMIVCAVLLAGHIFPAAPRIRTRLLRTLGKRGAIAVLVPLGAFVVYSAAVAGNWKTALAGAAYVLLPTLVLIGVSRNERATIVDYIAVLLIWLPVEFRWMYKLLPYPPPLMHTLTILLAVNTALAAFLYSRQLGGIGYAVEWRRGFAMAIGFNFLVFIAIAIPLGEALGFLHFAPSLSRLRSIPLAVVGIFFFTAWPEELLFRGLLQNLLTKSLKNEWAGLIAAALVFGASHLNNGGFPNWRYGILATIAGIFYGRAWIKTGSLLPGAIVHALVDILWHILFP
ncbi:MAG: type II CAAX endopeptidase family protein, partial [Candidatus Acidiferrales bacterium]